MPRAGLMMLFFAGEALAHPDHGSAAGSQLRCRTC
jgi:hypothetical protein